MVIGIDCDGVLANFSVAYAKLLTAQTGIKFPDYSKEEPTTWYWEREAGVTKLEEAQVWEQIRADKRFWFNLAPCQGAPEFLNNLDLMEHEVYFVTDRSGWMPQYQTSCWLQQFYTDPSVIISRKGKGAICKAIGIDVFLDDKVENIESIWSESPMTQAWMLRKPYNEKLHGADRVVGSLEEFAERTKLWS